MNKCVTFIIMTLCGGVRMAGRPKLEKKKDKFLSVRLPDEVRNHLLEYTKKHNESITNVTISALEEYFSKRR